MIDNLSFSLSLFFISSEMKRGEGGYPKITPSEREGLNCFIKYSGIFNDFTGLHKYQEPKTLNTKFNGLKIMREKV